LPIEPTPANYRLLTRQSESASELEISENPRATSVRLRAIEKVGGVAA
jgi:16S rRNA C1402 N4-methylase RsmH